MANELIGAASPYLLQHAQNPVAWRMWSEAALKTAQALDKPILLSIGYAACHWCHVMAHESFEDEATAAVMNELFINIKVDREERPDIDHIYMQALHSLGERGGWPLTMFLTPSGEPFWGGTYFPKVSQYGRPSFVTLLNTVAAAYHRDPKAIAANVTAIRRNLEKPPEPGHFELSLTQLDHIAGQLMSAADPVNGGLRGAPKFPNVPIFELLWRAGERSGQPAQRDALRLTMEKMSEGGVYDHLGGGYARYSTDERWLVPHFEKMLYDNAQLLECLALCFDAYRDPLFLQRARETVGWLEREMICEGGGFCASVDADSEGVEGKFYVWTYDEIVDVLGPENARFFADFYDASPRGNWTDAHYPDGVIVLNRLRARRPDAAEAERLARLRTLLFERRETRPRPALDDKIMADWNGLMIAALVNAATLTGEHRWIALAARAYEFILRTLRYEDAGGAVRLAHSARAGALTRPGLALDHAAMTRAALLLHEARRLGGGGERDYLADARAFAAALEADYLDPSTGLLCMAAKDVGDVILRLAPTADDAIPNAHPVYLDALIRLAALTGETAPLARADELLRALGPSIRSNVVGHAGALNALDLRLRVKEIVVAGPARRNLYEAALAAPFLGRVVMDLADDAELPAGHPVTAQQDRAGAATAYVCAAGVCAAPAHDVETLRRRLADEG